eukprot:scpid84650/ scgid12773/ 
MIMLPWWSLSLLCLPLLLLLVDSAHGQRQPHNTPQRNLPFDSGAVQSQPQQPLTPTQPPPQQAAGGGQQPLKPSVIGSSSPFDGTRPTGRKKGAFGVPHHFYRNNGFATPSDTVVQQPNANGYYYKDILLPKTTSEPPTTLSPPTDLPPSMPIRGDGGQRNRGYAGRGGPSAPSDSWNQRVAGGGGGGVGGGGVRGGARGDG